MKLATITFKATPRMPGMRPGDLVTINTDKPSPGLKGWRVSVRGQQVFFISPPGWNPDQSVKQRDPKGPVVIVEIPRSEVVFGWDVSVDEIEAALKGGKYDSEPFGPPPAPEPPKSLLPPLEPHEMGD